MITFRPQPLNNTRCWAELAGAVLHPIIYTRSAITDPTLELNEVTITPSVKFTHQPVEQHHLVSRSTKCHSAKLPSKHVTTKEEVPNHHPHFQLLETGG